MSQSTHISLNPFSSHLPTHSLRAEVTMFLGQLDGGLDRLLVALFRPLRHGAAGAAELAGDPLAGGVLHHLAALLLVEVSGGARHLRVISTLFHSLPCATLLEGPVALAHLVKVLLHFTIHNSVQVSFKLTISV